MAYAVLEIQRTAAQFGCDVVGAGYNPGRILSPANLSTRCPDPVVRVRVPLETMASV